MGQFVQVNFRLKVIRRRPVHLLDPSVRRTAATAARDRDLVETGRGESIELGRLCKYTAARRSATRRAEQGAVVFRPRNTWPNDLPVGYLTKVEDSGVYVPVRLQTLRFITNKNDCTRASNPWYDVGGMTATAAACSR